jgi:DNA-binding transcriptional MerR regulator
VTGKNVELGFPSSRVWKLANMPASTLDYWVRIGLVTPAIRQSEGRRVERWWSIRDVIVVRTIRALRQAGASLQDVQRAKDRLEAWGSDLGSAHLYWDGGDLQVSDDNGLVSVSRQPGQQMLQLVRLPVGAWEDELKQDEGIVEIDLARFRRLREERDERRMGFRVTTVELLTGRASGDQ